VVERFAELCRHVPSAHRGGTQKWTLASSNSFCELTATGEGVLRGRRAVSGRVLRLFRRRLLAPARLSAFPPFGVRLGAHLWGYAGWQCSLRLR
jgi:hypothetical protein